MQDPVMQWVTLAIAVYGAVLGSLGFWHSQRRDKPKITLIPEVLVTTSGTYRLLFRVINCGLIDVQITEVGFARKLNSTRAAFQPSPIRNMEPTTKLPAGSEVVLYVPASTIEHMQPLHVRYAYVAIGHGVTTKARNGALVEFLSSTLSLATDREIEDSLAGAGIASSSRGIPKSKYIRTD